MTAEEASIQQYNVHICRKGNLVYLASLKAAYGGNKKELEAQGWLFVDLEAPKKKDTSNADDK